MEFEQRQNLIIQTTGSTGQPKIVKHDWKLIDSIVDDSIELFELTEKDRVLNLYPTQTIANWTLSSLPAYKVNCELYNTQWNAYQFIDIMKEYKPTLIGIVPSHLRVLEKTKGWEDLSFAGCRVNIGADKVTQVDIDMLLEKGAEIVYHTYGMTEFPPPLAYGINSEWLSFYPTEHTFRFNEKNELIINDINTYDTFEYEKGKMRFLHRSEEKIHRKSWKNV